MSLIRIRIRKDSISPIWHTKIRILIRPDLDPSGSWSRSGKIQPKQIDMDLELFEILIRIKKLRRRSRIILMKPDHQTDAAPQYCLNRIFSSNQYYAAASVLFPGFTKMMQLRLCNTG
jgi:hypothetical protein